MQEKKGKQQLHPFLQTLKKVDVELSNSLSLSATPESPLGILRPYMKWLEISCHGIPWLGGCLVFLWFAASQGARSFFLNLFLGLLIDIVLVAVLKASIRRKRPSANTMDMFMTVSIDKLSCPSGHTSRAIFLGYVFTQQCSLWVIFNAIILIWCIAVCASRILLGRHHVGDMLLGVVLGYFEYQFVSWMWLSPEASQYFLGFFMDSTELYD